MLLPSNHFFKALGQVKKNPSLASCLFEKEEEEPSKKIMLLPSNHFFKAFSDCYYWSIELKNYNMTSVILANIVGFHK